MKIFTNELGNEITVSVEPAEAAPNCPGVLISLSGPTSLSENLITLREARELYAALGQHLAASNA